MKKRMFVLFLGVLVTAFTIGGLATLDEEKDPIDIGMNNAQQIVNL